MSNLNDLLTGNLSGANPNVVYDSAPEPPPPVTTPNPPPPRGNTVKSRSYLVQQIKTKYPEYKDWDDDYLQNEMVRKYPEYNDPKWLSPAEPESGGLLKTLGQGAATLLRYGAPVVAGISAGAATSWTGPGALLIGAGTRAAVGGAADYGAQWLEKVTGNLPEGETPSIAQSVVAGGANAIIPSAKIARGIGGMGRAAMAKLAEAAGLEGTGRAAAEMTGNLAGRTIAHSAQGAALGAPIGVASNWTQQASQEQKLDPTGKTSYVQALLGTAPWVDPEQAKEAAIEGMKGGALVGGLVGGAAEVLPIAKQAYGKRPAKPVIPETPTTGNASEQIADLSGKQSAVDFAARTASREQERLVYLTNERQRLQTAIEDADFNLAPKAKIDELQGQLKSIDWELEKAQTSTPQPEPAVFQGESSRLAELLKGKRDALVVGDFGAGEPVAVEPGAARAVPPQEDFAPSAKPASSRAGVAVRITRADGATVTAVVDPLDKLAIDAATPGTGQQKKLDVLSRQVPDVPPTALRGEAEAYAQQVRSEAETATGKKPTTTPITFVEFVGKRKGTPVGQTPMRRMLQMDEAPATPAQEPLTGGPFEAGTEVRMTGEDRFMPGTKVTESGPTTSRVFIPGVRGGTEPRTIEVPNEQLTDMRTVYGTKPTPPPAPAETPAGPTLDAIDTEGPTAILKEKFATARERARAEVQALGRTGNIEREVNMTEARLKAEAQAEFDRAIGGNDASQLSGVRDQSGPVSEVGNAVPAGEPASPLPVRDGQALANSPEQPAPAAPGEVGRPAAVPVDEAAARVAEWKQRFGDLGITDEQALATAREQLADEVSFKPAALEQPPAPIAAEVPPSAPPVAPTPTDALTDLIKGTKIAGIPAADAPPQTPLQTALEPSTATQTPEGPGVPPAAPAPAAQPAAPAAVPAFEPVMAGDGNVSIAHDPTYGTVNINWSRDFANANPEAKRLVQQAGWRYIRNAGWVRKLGEGETPESVRAQAEALFTGKQFTVPPPPAELPGLAPEGIAADVATSKPTGPASVAELLGMKTAQRQGYDPNIGTAEDIMAAGGVKPLPVDDAFTKEWGSLSPEAQKAKVAGQAARLRLDQPTGEGKPVTAKRIESVDQMLAGLVDDSPESAAQTVEAAKNLLGDQMEAATKSGRTADVTSKTGIRGGSSLYSLGSNGMNGLDFLLKENPELAKRLVGGIVGAMIGRTQDDDTNSFGIISPHAIAGFALGFGGVTAMQKLKGSALFKKGMAVASDAKTPYMTGAVKPLDATTKLNLDISPVERAGLKQARTPVNYRKDMSIIEALNPGGSIEAALGERVFRQGEQIATRQEKAMQALNAEARARGANPTGEEIFQTMSEIAKPFTKQLRADAKAFRGLNQTRRASYYEAWANDLEGKPTDFERRFADATGVKPYTQRRIVGGGTGLMYRSLLSMGVDTAASNLMQPILATADVKLQYLNRGFKALASEMVTNRGRTGKSWDATNFLKADTPTELSMEKGWVGPVASKNPRIQKAYEWLQKKDPNFLLVGSDNWNRRGVFLGAMEQARAQGATEDAAREWALQIVRKTQGSSGTRMALSNPKYRGALSMLVKPFTRYPSLFLESAYDAAMRRDAGTVRMATTFGAITAAGMALNIGLGEALTGGARPLGIDLTKPKESFEKIVSGDAMPAVRGAKDLYRHVTGTPQKHELVSLKSWDDFMDSDLPSVFPGRYPTKVAQEVGDFARYGTGTHPARTGSGFSKPHSGYESLLNLLGMKSGDQIADQKATREFTDEMRGNRLQDEADYANAKRVILHAFDRGDLATIQEMVRNQDVTGKQVQNILKNSQRNQAQQTWFSLSAKDKAAYIRRHGHAPQLGAGQ